jgi:hypothetical protein
MAMGTIDVDGQFAFGCWNQSAAERNHPIIARDVFLSFGDRIDEMESIWFPTIINNVLL